MKEYDALVIERDALAACVREQRRIMQLMSVALIATREAFLPETAAIEKAVLAVETAASAMVAAGIEEWK